MVGISVAVTMIALMIGWIAESGWGRTTWPDARAVSVCGVLMMMAGRAWDAETARARRGGGWWIGQGKEKSKVYVRRHPVVRREMQGLGRAKACTAYDGPVTGEQGRMEQQGYERGTGGDTVPRRLFDGPSEDVST